MDKVLMLPAFFALGLFGLNMLSVALHPPSHIENLRSARKAVDYLFIFALLMKAQEILNHFC